MVAGTSSEPVTRRPRRGGQAPPGSRSPLVWAVIGAAFLILGTLIAYLPALQSGYIWDDDFYVERNPTLVLPDALSRIWLEPSASPQYYPLVFTTFWIERHFWGTRPAGYHLINVLLHAMSAVFFWRLLRRLSVPGSYLAALLFALHPVQVESVAWITERKNVLSCFLYLVSATLYIRWSDRAHAARRNPALTYAASLLAFAAALFSKTTTATLPAALLLVSWWKQGRLERKVVVATLPYFALGLGLGLHTAWLEKHHVGAEGFAWSLTFLERFLIAGRAVLFYLQKLLLPINHVFIYPRWNLGAGAVRQVPYLLGTMALLIGLIAARRRIGRGPLVAFLFFVGTLFPALGFFDVYPFRYSYVADHFQYLATLGPLALAGAGLFSLLGRLSSQAGSDTQAAAGAGPVSLAWILTGATLVAVLAPLTWRQQRDYRDAETLWLRTLEKNPTAAIAQVNLGTIEVDRGHYEAALERFRRAIELNPEEYNGYFNGGSVLNQLRRYGEAIPYLEKATELFPKHPFAQYALGLAYLRTDRPGASVAPFTASLTLRADWSEPLNALAWVLTAYPDSAFANPPHGLELALRAKDLSGGRDPYTWDTVATAYAACGRFDEAVAALDQACALLEQNGDAATLAELTAKREAYSSGRVPTEIP